jgi:Domain of unknown function (DUF4149)
MVLALWAGSLVTVCAIAAPAAFAVLPDRQLAGRVAARLFLVETTIGVVASALFFATYAASKVVAPRSVAFLVAIAAFAPLASYVILSPLMDAARASGNMARFGALHGVSALLFLIACVCAPAALWIFNRPAA